MQQQSSAAIVRKLDTLIEAVEAQIGEQSVRILASDDPEQDEATLADMLATLEELHAFRDRFYATVH